MIYTIQNEKWRIDEDGFLTITIAVLNTKPMQYSPDELGIVNTQADSYTAATTIEEMQNSMESLEGSLATSGHTWQDIQSSQESVGHVKGSPRIMNIDGIDTLCCDVVITDEWTIDKVKNNELVEVSAAYRSEIDFDGGRDDVDATQKNIKFNHIALLPSGCGRGGHDIRILNHKAKEDMQMSETKQNIVCVKLKNSKKSIYVANESVDDIEELDEKVNNMVDQSALDETMAKLKEARNEVSRLEGELSATMDKLNQALSPEAIEAAADEMVQNEDDAEKIMNAASLKKDGVRRRGHELKSYVVNQIMIQNGKQPNQEQLNDHAFVSGYFNALAATAQPASKSVGVANLVDTTVQNSKQQDVAVNLISYFNKKGA